MPEVHAVATVSGAKLVGTAVLVLANGFFVAAEFALVKVRRTKIAALAREGDGAARVVETILDNLSLHLSACQLGITLASLALGWLAEPAVAAVLLWGADAVGLNVAGSPALHVVALVLALSIITILHITIGEQAPKVYAIARAEQMARWSAYPLRWFTLLFKPFIRFINAISNGLLRFTGVRDADGHGDTHDVEELRAILQTSAQAGEITARQRAFGENILHLINLECRHIMLPRVDVVFLTVERSTAENLEIIRRSGHTRFALCQPDLDNVIGMVHGKDVLSALIAGTDLDLAKIARPMPSVLDTLALSRFIIESQGAQKQCAVVVDEHGTTVGMVFLEDALEEIVGPIHDEFDRPAPSIETVDPGVIEISGGVPLPDAAALLNLETNAEEDTIGGYITATLGRLPAEGERIDLPPYRVTVLAVAKRRIAKLRFEAQQPPAPGGEPSPS